MNEAKFREVSVSCELAMSRDAAWQRMRDLSIPHNYVPDVIRTEMLSDEKEGLGATRRVFMSETRWVDEKVIEWNEGGGFLIDLDPAPNTPFPFAEAKFRYALEDGASAEVCVCRLSLHYRLKGSAPVAWLGGLAMGFLARNGLRKMCARLKAYYETGEPQR